MKNIIKLNSNTEIDLSKLVDSRLLVQANSGGGKSWLLRRLLEQSHGKVQQIIIDLEGEFSTLREKYDYILAGKGGDVPAQPKTAGLLARKILEMNVSAIIDLYELPHYERKHFVRLFLESMINAPKELWHSCLVVIDEAHIFAPEKGQSEAMEAVIDLATRGRKRGYCAILATQRLSKLHKDAAAECNNKLVGRTGLDIDMKRASEELGFTSKEQYLSLRHLNPGEFFAYGPAISKEVIKTKIGEIKTSHPKAGSRIITKTIPPTEKIKSVLKKLTDLPQEAEKEANTIADLKNEILLLKRNSQSNQTPKIDQTSIDRSVTIATQKLYQDFDRERNEWRRLVQYFDNGLLKFNEIFAVSKRPQVNSIEIKKQTTPVVSKPIIKNSVNPVDLTRVTDNSLSKCERAILTVLAQRSGKESGKNQIGILSGYSPNSGGFNNSLSRLRQMNYVNGFGDNIVITPEGLNNLGEYTPLPNAGDELQRYWQNKLSKSEGLILKALVENYPTPLTKEMIGEITGYSSGSGGFNNSLSRLRTLELIEGYGNIKASDNLFN